MKRMSRLLQVGCALILSVMAAAAQDPPSFYASGKFPDGAVYTEADLKGLVGRELPSPSYLEGRFVYLGFIEGRQLFSSFRPGLTDPQGIAFGDVLVAVTFHDNAPPGLEVGKVVVSTPREPLNLLSVHRLPDGQKIFAEAESRSLPVSQIPAPTNQK